MQVRKIAAVGADREDCASVCRAAEGRRSIQGVGRYYQSSLRIGSVAASSETMQGREGLGPQRINQYEAETSYQRMRNCREVHSRSSFDSLGKLHRPANFFPHTANLFAGCLGIFSPFFAK